MSVTVKSYAKINLTLEILGVENGYHILDSLVVSVNLFDFVKLKKRKGKLSSVMFKGLDGDGIPAESNALKAVEAFSATFGTEGADVTIYRNIPVGAGLGSSSADIVGVLNGMAKLYGVTDGEKLKALADDLGSDTGFMLDGGFARIRGRGEKVERLPFTPKLYALLICPKSGVSTKACYAAYDTQPKTLEYRGCPAEDCIRAFGAGKTNEGGTYLMNDLFRAACSLNSDVWTAYGEAQSFSPLGVCMTGSGSGVYALFETKELCQWAQSRYEGKFKTYVIETVEPKKTAWKNPFVL